MKRGFAKGIQRRLQVDRSTGNLVDPWTQEPIRSGLSGDRGIGGGDIVRSIPGERFTVNSEGLIEGHVIVFNQRTKIWDMFWEEIAPGSTARTIADPENDIRALKNHDDNWVLGRQGNSTVTLREDKTGLLATITPPKTTWADDLRVSIQRGDTPGASFRFRPMKTETTVLGDGMDLDRHIDISVSEVSVGVAWPAYEGTQIDARSDGGLSWALLVAIRSGNGEQFDRCVALIREQMVIQKTRIEETTVWGFDEDPASQLAALELLAQE